jgi:deoxyribonuclease (pyrimidine dimer)
MINVIPVTELCNQHLLSECKAIPKIPLGLLCGKLSYNYDDRPSEYVVGAGHIRFFTDKLCWLRGRYMVVSLEAGRRGLDVQDIWPWPGLQQNAVLWEKAWNDWRPDAQALRINRARLRDRMPAQPKWS